jgi:4-hydroxybenzoate polyprenyltransferase
MPAFIKLMRPHQYVKNLFVFFPLFFALKITDLDLVKEASIAFLSFCFAASTIYIINDIRDIEKDRAHPKKKKRPLASGKVNVMTAIAIAAILFFFSIILATISGKNLLLIISIYIVMNFFYSFGLKNIPLVDIFIIATGFLLRLLAGTEFGAVEGVNPSHWIMIMTFLLSLFIAFAKRRDDLILAEKGVSVRKSIEGYSIDFVNNAMSVMSGVLIVSYLLYTLDEKVVSHFNTEYLYVTTVFVILGVFRYMQISLVFMKSGSPTEIVFKDKFLQLTIVGWAALFLLLVY